jgi:putative hydrolase of HD superfamily
VEDPEVDAAARLIQEMGLLKLSARTGWWQCGVSQPESVAEHSFRTAIIASILAGMEDCDPARAAHLALWHDSQETRLGDIPYLGRRYLTAAANEAVTADQTEGLPDAVARNIRSVVHDYETGDDPEVRCAHDADRLDCLFQAIAYRDDGYVNVGRWVESSSSRLKTESAARLAKAALGMSAQSWLGAALGEP